MTNTIITFFRNFDPASEFSIGSTVGGEVDTVWAVWMCYGHAVSAEHSTQQEAEAHLAVCKAEARTFRRVVEHNWWRLVGLVRQLLGRLTSSAKHLDQIIP